jgi:hypothetical protein
MRYISTFFIALLVYPHLSAFEGQDIKDDSSFLKSIQGTWAYTESGADLWLKVVIKGKTLKAFAAYPDAGKFTAESERKIRVVKLVYKSKLNPGLKSESFAQIGDSFIADNRLYSGTVNGEKYISFGDRDAPKLMKVPSDFNPWE